MLSLEQFSQLAAIISAMVDLYTIGAEPFLVYLSRRQSSSEYRQNGQVLKQALSTYSDAEIDAIKDRIESCRDRFIKEGSGSQRRTCLCSVLSDVRDGNRGAIPIQDWEDMFKQLGC